MFHICADEIAAVSLLLPAALSVWHWAKATVTNRVGFGRYERDEDDLP